jgi:O-antigen/teichoic acid export membrane protein
MESEQSGFYRRVLAGFAWQGSSKIVVQAVSWISTIVVARLLEPSDYGVMAIANVFLWLTMAFMDMGLSQALIHKGNFTTEEEDAVFWLSVALGTGLFVLLFLAAPAIADFYAIPAITDVLRLSGLGLIIGSLKAVPQAIVMRQLDFRTRSLIEVGASLTSTITVVALAFTGHGVWSLVWGLLAQQIVIAFGFLPALRRWPGMTWNFARVADTVHYGLHIMGANLAFVISSRADVFIIGKFLGEHFTGIYSLAFQLATMPLDKIGTVFNHVAFPSLSRVKDDDARCRTLFAELHRYLLFIAYPLLIGLAVVAEDLVAVLLGEKWLQTVPVLQALCVVNVIRISGMLISPALTSRGRQKDALRYSAAGMVLLPLAFLGGVQFGLEGVAVAWIVSYPLLYGMLLRYLNRDLAISLPDLINDSRPTLIATVVMAVAVVVAQDVAAAFQPAARLAVGVAVGAAAYTGVFVIFYGEQVTRMRRALRELRSGSSA